MALRRTVAIAVVAVIALAAFAVSWNVAGLKDRITAIASPSPMRSIAVLPLENQSNDPAQQYFADGFTDALIADLSKLQALKVISRASSMQSKPAQKPLQEIARQLGVDAVVEGAVGMEEGRVRTKVSLIRAATGKIVWTETYTRDLQDILALQNDIARAIAGQIRLTLTPDEQTRLAGPSVDPQVYRLYLQAQSSLNQGDLRPGCGLSNCLET